MILIVGGSCQGKAEYARSLAPEKDCLLNFHGFLRQVMEGGGDTDAFTKEVIRERPEVVTLDEVGNGIVPIEAKEREYREAVGRAGQMLAAEADQVIRMVCGIPVRIK